MISEEQRKEWARMARDCYTLRPDAIRASLWDLANAVETLLRENDLANRRIEKLRDYIDPDRPFPSRATAREMLDWLSRDIKEQNRGRKTIDAIHRADCMSITEFRDRLTLANRRIDFLRTGIVRASNGVHPVLILDADDALAKE
jgi:hypothetical protein